LYIYFFEEQEEERKQARVRGSAPGNRGSCGNNSPVYWHPVVGRAGEKIQKTHYPSPSQRHGAWRGGTDSFCEEVLQGELETFVGAVRF